VDGELVGGDSLWPQRGTTNSKTYSVQHFQPPTMSISMSNKCGIQACPQIYCGGGLDASPRWQTLSKATKLSYGK
jgi:hypothetical protein